MTKIVEVDVSTLEPPQPMTEITKLLTTLPQGSVLRVTHRRKPLPLFEIIKTNFLYRHIEINEGDHLIFVWHRDDNETSDYVRRQYSENDRA